MSNTISRRILAGVAATTLALGVTACSEAEDAASQAGDAAGSATSAAGEAASSATSAAGEANESATASASESAEPSESTEGSDSETTEFKTADGKSVLVPAAFAEALDDAAGDGDFGTPATIEEGENGSFLAAFDNGNHITYSEETGAVKLIGEIGNTWVADGALANPIGLPTDTESEVDGGWTQEFQNGAISWLKGEAGDFAAEVEQA